MKIRKILVDSLFFSRLLAANREGTLILPPYEQWLALLRRDHILLPPGTSVRDLVALFRSYPLTLPLPATDATGSPDEKLLHQFVEQSDPPHSDQKDVSD